jgi:hypothetical protein
VRTRSAASRLYVKRERDVQYIETHNSKRPAAHCREREVVPRVAVLLGFLGPLGPREQQGDRDLVLLRRDAHGHGHGHGHGRTGADGG